MQLPDFRNWLVFASEFLGKRRSKAAVRKILILLFSFTLLVSIWILSTPHLEKNADYVIGDIAKSDLRNPYEIRYIITEETEKLRREARLRERPVFDRNSEALDEIVRILNTETSLFVRTLRESRLLETMRSRLVFLNDRTLYPDSLLSSAINSSIPENLADLSDDIAQFVFNNYAILPVPLPVEVARDVERNSSYIRTIRTRYETPELVWDSSRFMTLTQFARNAKRISLTFEKTNADNSAVITLLLIRSAQLMREKEVFSYNEHQSNRRKEIAAQSVTPVTGSLAKGTFLLREGDIVDRETYQKLQILNTYRTKARWRLIGGMFLIMALLAFSTAFYILRFWEFSMNDLSSNIILHSLLLFIMVWAWLALRFDQIAGSGIHLALFVPVSFFSIMTSILFGARVTMVVGIFLSIFLYLLAGYDSGTMFLSITSIFTGSYAASRMQKRIQFIKGAHFIAAGNMIVCCAMDLIRNTLGENLELKFAFAAINAIVSVILTVSVLPLYENLFNLPTKFRLLEMADFNSPLLRKLATTAPSTYSHSLMMANLSERAVAAIGGDTLLTKVGCLYHDIGKMLNPGFYAENKHLSPTNENFKKLGPEKSAQMIIRHVTDGIRMAREHHLPEKIIAFIPEHHGTTTMQYFYHKALEELNRQKSKKTLDRKLFQYPGPPPASKETGVVMIADSVEAASRSLAEPNRENFARLVDEIIQNKMDENQFDNCPLTISDLKKIKTAFVDVLVSHYHSRPVYPKMQETKNLELENASLSSLVKSQEAKTVRRARNIKSGHKVTT